MEFIEREWPRFWRHSVQPGFAPVASVVHANVDEERPIWPKVEAGEAHLREVFEPFVTKVTRVELNDFLAGRNVGTARPEDTHFAPLQGNVASRAKRFFVP